MTANRLSSHLAELTNNHTYTDAAILAAQFIENHLYGPDHLVRKGLNLTNCYVDSSTWSTDSATAFHGWSVLADIAHDNHWRDMYMPSPFSLTAPALTVNIVGQSRLLWLLRNPSYGVPPTELL
jgi:hypothetical protein